MAVKFQDILKKSSKLGESGADWFRNKVLDMRSSTNPKSIIKRSKPINRRTTINHDSIGKMFLFSYSPKGKETLPYYDTYPLVFPIEFYGDSFLGINLHYLPPVLRAKLMDALYELINNDKYDDSSQLTLSYKILAGAARFSYFKPCVKKYLFTHVGSSFMYIAPDEWDVALMLPTERFAKATNSQVWADSRGKV